MSNNAFLTKLSNENKADKIKFSEDIEIKFVTAKDQFEKEFKDHLVSFDKELKQKETEFLNKIKNLYNEKEALVIEMTSFKDEIAILSKDYLNKFDSELKNINVYEVSFNSEWQAFFTYVDELIKVKKLELQDYSNSLEKNIYELLKSQKESFDNNENSFREIFNEKITALNDLTIKKLDSIEKKFLDKNIKIINEKVEAQIEYLELFEQKIL